jgi:hypothetical protein
VIKSSTPNIPASHNKSEIGKKGWGAVFIKVGLGFLSFFFWQTGSVGRRLSQLDQACPSQMPGDSMTGLVPKLVRLG